MKQSKCSIGFKRVEVYVKALLCLAFASGGGFIPLIASNDGSSSFKTEIVQQDVITVSGKVTDAKGEPIIGATVVENGNQKNGTVTNADGKYALRIKRESTVIISYVGYTSLESKGGDAILEEDLKSINEVVVIGYGTQKKGDVTSAISTVKAEDFNIGNISDAGQLIKGKVAGLNITNSSGDPNTASTIRLRGVISLQGSSTPLVLIDGIEGDLQTVAPENIASIDVLKDASAAAIYGTRGANGVIIITTKSGHREEKVTTTYSGYVGWSHIAKKLDFMTAEDVRNGLTDFKDEGSDTDWVDELTRTAFTHNHNLSITGGTKTTSYSADFTFRQQQGTIIGTYGNEMKLNMNLAHWVLNDILKFSFNLQKNWHKNSITNANDDETSTLNSNLYHQAIIRNPTSPVKNEDGSWNENFGASYYWNPIEMANESRGYYKTEETRMTGNITVEPIKNWQTNLMLSTVHSNAHTNSFLTSDYYSSVMNNYDGQGSHNYAHSRSDNLELTSKYQHNWGLHRFEGLVGYSYQYNMNEGFYAYNRNFPTDFFQAYNLESGLALRQGEASMSSYKDDNKLVGFFGRVSYGYAEKYNVLLSIRREGSSKFGDNHKWGNFPSASFGWTISNEKFMNNLKWVDNLKLRVGYGVTGVIPNESYISLTRYDYGSSYYYDNGIWKPGLEIASNPNPDLKWEKSEEINVGLDWSLFEGRLSGSIDFYNKTTKDMLWDYSVPTPPNLYSTTKANVGKMRNRGVELVINAIPVQTKDFEWRTTFTISHNSNKLISLSNDTYQTTNYIDVGWMGEPVSMPLHRIEAGQRIDRYFGFKTVGVSENGIWLVQLPDGKTINGKNVVELDDNVIGNSDYKQYLGHALPDVYLGWNNTFNYKNFDLSMQFTSQLGYKIFNEARAFYENNTFAFNRLRSVLDPPYGGDYVLSNKQMQNWNSYHLENGDFLKMTNLTLGYKITLKNNKYVSSIRPYIACDNLFTITGYKGIDPELSNGSFEYFGMDYRDKYPSTRSYTLGVSLTF